MPEGAWFALALARLALAHEVESAWEAACTRLLAVLGFCIGERLLGACPEMLGDEAAPSFLVWCCLSFFFLFFFFLFVGVGVRIADRQLALGFASLWRFFLGAPGAFLPLPFRPPPLPVRSGDDLLLTLGLAPFLPSMIASSNSRECLKE